MSRIHPWLLALALLVAVGLVARQDRLMLRDPALVTGWALLLVCLLLAGYNLRKRLSMLPAGRSSTWLLIHALGGLAAMALFWMHTGLLWPTGHYERLLATLFYLVSITGLAGYLLQRIYPRRLTTTGLEIIFERIPAELAETRERAESLVLRCVEEAGNDTLARLYLESLDWFFRKPRFFLNHAFFGKKSEHWVRQRCAAVRNYLTEVERGYLEQLNELARHKARVDFHYAAQLIMKGWLLIHVPLATGVIALALWHVLLVHVYLV